MDINGFPPNLLIPMVASIAFLYSSIGFGGATGYLAAMSLFSLSPQLMASTALSLNIFVASIAFISYWRAGHLKGKLLWPFLITSIPAAFAGGYMKLSNEAYFVLLYSILTLVMVRMLFFSNGKEKDEFLERDFPLWAALLAGLAIGLLSGMVGIGGGVFLSPLIILARWGSPKNASATSAAFIVLNSISGLVGRLLGANFVFGTFGATLLPVGILAALAGSLLGARYFSSIVIRRLLGLVMLILVARYWLSLIG